MTDETQPPSINDNNLVAKELDNNRIERHSLTQAIRLNQADSSIFNTECSLNPLAAAAAPVLTIANKILPEMTEVKPRDLYQLLSEEIHRFEDKARQLDYRANLILAARYFLCAYVDEIIQDSSAAIRNFWHKHSLLQEIQGESWGGERFFLILERACDDAKAHIHLLELGFLCLNLGYQGQYKKVQHKQEELDNIKENLFELIKKVRGSYSSKLYYREESATPEVVVQQKQVKRRFPHILLASGLLLAGLLAIYLPYQSQLKQLGARVVQSIDNVSNSSATGQ